MLVRTGHGPEDWRDEGPATATIGDISGRRPDGYEADQGRAHPWRLASQSELPLDPSRTPADAGRTRIQAPEPRCELTARCRHRPCVTRRVHEAKRLYETSSLTLTQIGALMGGRDHSTVIYWLREYVDKDAA